MMHGKKKKNLSPIGITFPVSAYACTTEYGVGRSALSGRIGVSRSLATHLFGETWKSGRFLALEGSYTKDRCLVVTCPTFEVPLYDNIII